MILSFQAFYNNDFFFLGGGLIIIRDLPADFDACYLISIISIRPESWRRMLIFIVVLFSFKQLQSWDFFPLKSEMQQQI